MEQNKPEEGKTSPEREKVLKAIAEAFPADGSHDRLKKLYQIQADALHWAWITAGAELDRLVEAGDVPYKVNRESPAKTESNITAAEKLFEIRLDLMKQIYTKITLGIDPPPQADIVTPGGPLEMQRGMFPFL